MKITRQVLENLLQSEHIEALSLEQLQKLFIEEEGTKKFIPDGLCQVDPRNGDRIVFNSSRAHRPHDNLTNGNQPSVEFPNKECVICHGTTTGVVDAAYLSQGFTFINKNLFPIFFPAHGNNDNVMLENGDNIRSSRGIPANGYHFLQWTSSHHDIDWHNMPRCDRVVVVERMAALERKLLLNSANPARNRVVQGSKDPPSGYVSIIKNYGHLVGGSLAHGHQQITFSNVVPRRVLDHQRFAKEFGEKFAMYMLRENPERLLVRDYGLAQLIVPYFMRRPFEMFLFINDTTKGYLYELNDSEIAAVADGWHDAIQAMLAVMPQIGKETAYNVVTNSGPGCGLYFEFLPYTQETGGFEHLGMFLCQNNPGNCAKKLRSVLGVPKIE